MQRRKWYSGQMPAAKTHVLWYEFDCDGKFSHVKLLIKEKYSHTIITERYRFCCFNSIRSYNGVSILAEISFCIPYTYTICCQRREREPCVTSAHTHARGEYVFPWRVKVTEAKVFHVTEVGEWRGVLYVWHLVVVFDDGIKKGRENIISTWITSSYSYPGVVQVLAP